MREMNKDICEKTGKKMNTRYYFKWYPLSKQYSYVFNYPNDIKPEQHSKFWTPCQNCGEKPTMKSE